MQPYPNQGHGNPPAPNQAQYQPSPNPQPQTIVLQNPNHGKKKTYRLAESQVMVHGVMHIVIGFVCVIFNSVLISLGHNDYFGSGVEIVGAGIWCGLFFIIIGAFGVVASKQKSLCFIITYMVLCICNTLMSIVMLGFAAGMTGQGNVNLNKYNNQYFYGASWETHADPIDEAFVGMGATMIFLSFVELVISIWSSALCCAAVCCCRDSVGVVNQPVVTYNSGMAGQVVYIHTNNPAGMLYNNQGQATYITHQGGVPVHMAATTQAQGPPGYSQASSAPPSYNSNPHPANTEPVVPATGSTPAASTAYPTKGGMANIDS